MNLLHNIDDVRTEIMRLERAPAFDAEAWARVLADLESAGRVSALADARRRMETAKENQPIAENNYDFPVMIVNPVFVGVETEGVK